MKDEEGNEIPKEVAESITFFHAMNPEEREEYWRTNNHVVKPASYKLELMERARKDREALESEELNKKTEEESF